MYEGLILRHGRHLINCSAVVFVYPREFFIFDPNVTNISLFYSFYLFVYSRIGVRKIIVIIHIPHGFDIKVQITIDPYRIRPIRLSYYFSYTHTHGLLANKTQHYYDARATYRYITFHDTLFPLNLQFRGGINNN